MIGGRSTESVGPQVECVSGAVDVLASSAGHAGPSVRSLTGNVHGLIGGIGSEIAGVRHRGRCGVDLDDSRISRAWGGARVACPVACRATDRVNPVPGPPRVP